MKQFWCFILVVVLKEANFRSNHGWDHWKDDGREFQETAGVYGEKSGNYGECYSNLHTRTNN